MDREQERGKRSREVENKGEGREEKRGKLEGSKKKDFIRSRVVTTQDRSLHCTINEFTVGDKSR